MFSGVKDLEICYLKASLGEGTKWKAQKQVVSIEQATSKVQ